jgi:hypothetical protein
MILTRESAGQRIHRRTVLEYALESQSASVTSPAISLRSVGGSWVGKKDVTYACLFSLELAKYIRCHGVFCLYILIPDIMMNCDH